MHEREQSGIFDEWLSSHRRLFYKVVHAFAFTAADRDDLFQEIAVRVWQSIPRFRGEASLGTWIYRVALYSAIAWSRRERKHRTGMESLEGVELSLLEREEARDPRLAWLYEQIAELDEIDRSVTLLLLDGFSYREIAGMLGISESHVGVKVHRIKSHLNQESQKEKAL